VGIRLFVLLIVASALTLPLSAGALSIAVRDPQGALVRDAAIFIQHASGGIIQTLKSDDTGSASADDLGAGEYKVTAEKAGFERYEGHVTLPINGTIRLIIDLKLAVQESTIRVEGKISALANSDTNYRALRDAQLNEGQQVSGLVLKRDVGVFTFKSGTFTFATPVNGKTVYAVFSGDATFHLKPVVTAEANYMKMLSGATEADEDFSSAVFCFTDGTAAEIRAAGTPVTPPAAAGLAWRDFRDRTRKRNDPPRSMLESLLGNDDIGNVDADLLADLYAQSRTTFLAYMHGRKHDDLRFIVNQSGAVPALRSPEEVALINYDPGAEHEGIWYMSHLQSEWEKKTASSDEDRHWARAISFKIDTTIGNNDHLAATAVVRLRALADGLRVLRFGLLPSLRVSSVRLGNSEIAYIQEGKKQDGSFYVVFPQGMKAGSDAEVTIFYEGDKVVRNAGNGNFAVGARESWYPSLNSFADRATYDLTFRIPKRYMLVSVGHLEKSWVEQDYGVTHWFSEIPLAVAGFNYGDYRKYSKMDETTNYLVETYATHDMPAGLQNAAISPTAMAQNTLVDAQNAIRCFEYYFGSLPYGRLAITQQPQFNFGQSWPTLIYLPVSAFMDNTQRWMLMQGAAFRFNDFISEVTPHEVSHQWWGHAVGWATYRDQWLSEGFAVFSAGLFLQNTGKADEYNKYWEMERKRLADKNAFGLRAGEAIPLWMGIRLDTFQTPRGYSLATYSKGGFILHMLRSMMWDPKTQDKDFIDMMKDFVTTNYNKDPSTENFMTIASKHMTPQMDLAGDHRLLWFFQQWVYGTAMPKYRFEYSLKDEPEGKTRLTGTLTQSNVTDNFRMMVPIYADFDGKDYMRLGSTFVSGNKSGQPFSVLLPKRPKKVAANRFNDVLAIETVDSQVN
jgi:Peptidase family M1 domain/Carboxypeptidase regulatory-like domain